MQVDRYTNTLNIFLSLVSCLCSETIYHAMAGHVVSASGPLPVRATVCRPGGCLSPFFRLMEHHGRSPTSLESGAAAIIVFRVAASEHHRRLASTVGCRSDGRGRPLTATLTADWSTAASAGPAHQRNIPQNILRIS